MESIRSALPWQTEAAVPVVVILSFVSLYLLYHFATSSESFRRFFSSWSSERRGEVSRILAKRGLFALLIGVVPAILVITVLDRSLSSCGWMPVFNLRSLLWIGSLSAGLSLVSLLSRNSPATQRSYPQIRARQWTRGDHALNVASWALYLYAYEFGYRGYLVLLGAEVLGVWPAVALSVALYAALHIPNGPIEAFGCIPLGIIFAIAALDTGTVWVPFLAHFASAVVNDLLTFHSNPQFGMVPRRRS
ncbi:MAG: CPBP family intramembrane metalloprotease [Spirochaetales bacterium]|nr:CPBP family intramembrane metalloprotease [Spirochaetales bacterium]